MKSRLSFFTYIAIFACAMLLAFFAFFFVQKARKPEQKEKTFAEIFAEDMQVLAKNASAKEESFIYKLEDLRSMCPSYKEEYLGSICVSDGKVVYTGMPGKLEDLAKQNNITRDKKAFIFTWEAKEDGEELILPLPEKYSYNFVVNYGDNLEREEANSARGKGTRHTYAKKGRYMVTINGQLDAFKTGVANGSVIGFGENLISVENLGSFENIRTVECFGDCGFKEFNLINTKLEKVNAPESYSFKNLVNCDYMFYDAAIKEVFPDNFFASAKNAKSFVATFCMAKVSSIPENTFKENVLAENFSSCFAWSDIDKIPQNIFANNTEITLLTDTFRECTNVTGEVPSLWDGRFKKLKNASKCFAGVVEENIPDEWR